MKAPVKSAPVKARPASTKPAGTKAKAAPRRPVSSAPSKTVKKISAKTAEVKGPNLDIVMRYADGSCEAVIEELMGSRVVEGVERGYADLASGNWKIRLEGVQNLKKFVKDGDFEAEVVWRVLLKKFTKENNFQVMNCVVEIMAGMCDGVGCGAASLVVPILSEKLGDGKVKKGAGEVLGCLAEATTFGFVLGLMYEPVRKLKSPKVIGDVLAWIEVALVEFGIAGVDVKQLVGFVKSVGLGNTNAGLRGVAVKLITCVRMFAVCHLGYNCRELVLGRCLMILGTRRCLEVSMLRLRGLLVEDLSRRGSLGCSCLLRKSSLRRLLVHELLRDLHQLLKKSRKKRRRKSRLRSVSM